MENDGAAAGAPPMTPQSALPPVAGWAVGSTPPAPPPVATPESGALEGGAASAAPSQAATPKVVASGRPKDLDWWVPPTHPTAMGEGGHLLSIYRTFPDSEQVTAWNHRLARFPRQVALPAVCLVDLPALLEREDWGQVDRVRRCLTQSTAADEVAAYQPVVDWRWCFQAPPYLATGDPHVNHPAARHEYVWRRDERHLDSVLKLEFPRARDHRRGNYVVLLKWWKDVEVPMGFPAMLPRFLAYYSSRMRPNEEGLRLYAILATQWVVEVASVRVASLKSKGYLWHLSNALVEGMRTLTPARLGDGRDGDYAELLEEMIILHNALDWVSVQPFLRRTATEGGAEATTRGFVHWFCGLSRGKSLLREGLGLDSYPYSPGIGAQSPPPASGWMVSGKRHAPPKNTERRVTYPPPSKRNLRGHGPSSQAGPSRAGPSQARAAAYVDLDVPAAATLPPPKVVHRGLPTTAAAVVVTPLESPALAEPFPAANVRADFCRGSSLPEQCTRGLLTLFPPVGADIWDASPVVAVIALAEVLARVSRPVFSSAVDVHQAGQPVLAQRLINELSGRALEEQLRVQLSTTLSQLPTYGSGQGSTPHLVSTPPSSGGQDPSDGVAPASGQQWHNAPNYGRAPAPPPQNYGSAGGYGHYAGPPADGSYAPPVPYYHNAPLYRPESPRTRGGPADNDSHQGGGHNDDNGPDMQS